MVGIQFFPDIPKLYECLLHHILSFGCVLNQSLGEIQHLLEYTDAETIVNGFLDYESEQGVDVESVQTALDSEADDYDPAAAKAALTEFATTISDADTATYSVVDEETMADEEVTSTGADFQEAAATMDKYDYTAPDPADYGVWIPGIPVLVENVLDKVGCAEWLRGLIQIGRASCRERV